jgi:hypothetical protein
MHTSVLFPIFSLIVHHCRVQEINADVREHALVLETLAPMGKLFK